MRTRRATTRQASSLVPFIRSVAENVDWRAVGGLFTLLRQRSELRLGKPVHYVYILQSSVDERRFYTGLTDNLRERLQNHNAGRVRHTAKWKPWRLKSYIALSDRMRAAEFERYLKSASGRAFVRKRL